MLKDTSEKYGRRPAARMEVALAMTMEGAEKPSEGMREPSTALGGGVAQLRSWGLMLCRREREWGAKREKDVKRRCW